MIYMISAIAIMASLIIYYRYKYIKKSEENKRLSSSFKMANSKIEESNKFNAEHANLSKMSEKELEQSMVDKNYVRKE